MLQKVRLNIARRSVNNVVVVFLPKRIQSVILRKQKNGNFNRPFRKLTSYTMSLTRIITASDGAFFLSMFANCLFLLSVYLSLSFV